MDHDDPFGINPDDAVDRTIIRPRPGGKGPVTSQRPWPQSSHRENITAASPLPPRQGANNLETAASSLLTLLGRLHDTPSHPNPASLKTGVIDEIRTFETKSQNLGIEKETIFWARYVLCTAIDEAVLLTPWGNQSVWRDQSLLVTLHNEAWGGEKFFQLLQKLLQNPSRNLDLLELMYICLAFGFEGRYRPLPDGNAQLQTVRDNLYRTIRNQHEDYERDLSSHWKGANLKKNPLVQYVPLWVVLAISAVLLLLMFFGFNLSLNVKSDPVHAKLHNIARNIQTVVERKPEPIAPIPEPEPRVTLRMLLTPEIEAQKISLEEDRSQARVRIRGDGLFSSGSVLVRDEFQPLLDRIAWALNQVDGDILVVGHTDNIPIRSLRFPSNWHLSRARADAVSKILTENLNLAGRIQSEGQGSAEPLAPNDTKQNRARNRRVEITLLKQ